MTVEDFGHEPGFRKAWEAVKIARPVHYSLFTFGESLLRYYLVCGQEGAAAPAIVTRGEVRITRPAIITAQNAEPELRDFFDNPREEQAVKFILARRAHFSGLKFAKRSVSRQVVHESVETVVARLNRLLDEQQEDRVAILTAPPKLGGLAVFRYAVERVWRSGPDNIQELRERGLLP